MEGGDDPSRTRRGDEVQRQLRRAGLAAEREELIREVDLQELRYI